MNIRELIICIDEQVKNNKKIALYGAASSGERAVMRLLSFGFEKKSFIFCDSNISKHGSKVRGVDVVGLPEILESDSETTFIVTSVMHYEIIPYLQKTGIREILFSQDLIFDRTVMPRYSEDFVHLLASQSDSTNVSMEEAWNLSQWAFKTRLVEGCMAEVGVYKGGTAAILSHASDSHLHLFDTFNGLPASKMNKDDLVASGWLDDADVATLKKLLKNPEAAFLHIGIFPETTSDLECEKFALVHLDTDIYRSTLDGLEFFYPKMSTGGAIIIHDYNNEGCPGVKRAVNEFLSKNRVQFSVELAETQILIQK